MKRLLLILMIIGTGPLISHAEQPAFVAPSAQRIAALLEFSGPVNLTQRIATPEQLANQSARAIRKGKVIASFSYRDPERTSEDIKINVYAAGSFLGQKRSKLEERLAGLSESDKQILKNPETGIFKATDGRSIYQFPAGFGPGGSAYVALLPCRDTRYELVLIQTTDHHDDEDGKQYSEQVSPKKDLKSIIEIVESIVFP